VVVWVAASVIALAGIVAGCVPGTKASQDAATTTVPLPVHASGPSAGCNVTPAAPPGSTDVRMTSGGKERSYQLDIPASYDGTKPLPIVLGLHSLTVSYKFVPALSGFPEMNAKYDFIDVAPSGLLDGKTPYWNAAPVADNYDVTFINDLLDHLEATLCVDTARVFSVGMSNGAQMSSLLACRLPERITAIAAISGVEFNEPCDGAPVPVMAFHGALDPIVPYAGGGLNAVKIADVDFYKGSLPAGLPAPHGVDDSMKLWAQHNGCDPDPVEERVSPEVRKRTWPNCQAATVLYIVDDGGHQWPGMPQPSFDKTFGHGTTDIDATSLLFAFFLGQKA
jgi:polyhydroxybutyrate depolymerase